MDMELHLVVCVSFAPPPLLFIEGCHGFFCREFSPEPPGTDLGIEWGANMWKVGPRTTDLWSADHVGRPTSKGGRSAPNLTGTLLGGPPCHMCGAWLVLRWFGSSGGPVDPRECV